MGVNNFTRCETVSTHSRLKAADVAVIPVKAGADVSTHSRLKAAGLSILFK